MGIVYDFILEDGEQPPKLPKAILIRFDNYTGPSFLGEKEPKIVALAPTTFENYSKIKG